ncbi:MAG: carcinine hydrolase/isopenicillin-N N-acyltransferase family protein [Planctomycetota bacterium]
MVIPAQVGGVPITAVAGTPRAMGEFVGARLKPQLQAVAKLLLARLVKGLADAGRAMSEEQVRAALTTALAAVVRQDPSQGLEFEAIAGASQMRPEEMLLIHGYGDMLGILGSAQATMRSTYVGLNAVHTDHGLPRLILAWHLDPALLPYVTVVHRTPAHGPASLTLTLAGLHPVAGISAAGLAVAVNELRVDDGAHGFLLSGLVAAALAAPTREDAVRRAQVSPRFGGGCIHLLDAQGERMSLELSGQRCAQLPDSWPHAPRVHCNQALTDEVNRRTPRTLEPGSQPRLERIAALAVEARSCAPEQTSEWFHLGKAGANRSAEGTARIEAITPGGTVLFVGDPNQRTIHVLRAGAGEGVGSMTL